MKQNIWRSSWRYNISGGTPYLLPIPSSFEILKDLRPQGPGQSLPLLSLNINLLHLKSSTNLDPTHNNTRSKSDISR